MGLFSTDGCTISAVSLSSTNKEIIKEVTSGNAFLNPVKGDIDGISASISSTTSLITGAGNTAIWSSLTGDLASLNTTLNSYLSHSNRLSGVNLGATGPSGEPGLNGLIGIAKAYNSVCESMTGGTKDNFTPVFDSILGPGSSKIKREKEIIENVKIFVRNNSSLGSATTPFNTELANHITSVKASKDVIQKLITDDNASYDNAQTTVRNYNLGNELFSSKNAPCFTGKLFDSIGSPVVKEKLNTL